MIVGGFSLIQCHFPYHPTWQPFHFLAQRVLTCQHVLAFVASMADTYQIATAGPLNGVRVWVVASGELLWPTKNFFTLCFGSTAR